MSALLFLLGVALAGQAAAGGASVAEPGQAGARAEGFSGERVAAPTPIAPPTPVAPLTPVAAPERLAPPRRPRPIRTNEPGTGVFIGSGLLTRAIFDRQASEREALETWTAVADFRYTPATHWVVGIRVPYVVDRRLESASVGEVSASGLGDLSAGVKHRFFRRVGRWSDRHAAFELDAKLPTGSTGIQVDPGLPIERRRQLQPGSGSVDFVADLVYQEGRQRFVYGGDLSFRLNTEGEDHYRFGNELRLNLDVEYILFPLEYRRPGNELFVLLETTLRRKWADEAEDRGIPRTARTDLLLAPAVQHIVTEQLLFSLSVQFPLVSRAGETSDPGGGGPSVGDGPAGGLEQDLNVLAELRYAF